MFGNRILFLSLIVAMALFMDLTDARGIKTPTIKPMGQDREMMASDGADVPEGDGGDEAPTDGEGEEGAGGGEEEAGDTDENNQAAMDEAAALPDAELEDIKGQTDALAKDVEDTAAMQNALHGAGNESAGIGNCVAIGTPCTPGGTIGCCDGGRCGTYLGSASCKPAAGK